MEEITTFGLDLAKRVFHVHGANPHGDVLLRKKLGRGQVLDFFSRQPQGVVAMEACSRVVSQSFQPVGNSQSLGKVMLQVSSYCQIWCPGVSHAAA